MVAVQKDTVSNLALGKEGRRWFVCVCLFVWKILSVGKTEKARGTVEQPMQRPVYENMVHLRNCNWINFVVDIQEVKFEREAGQVRKGPL